MYIESLLHQNLSTDARRNAPDFASYPHALEEYVFREFRDVVFEDVVFDNDSSVTPH